MEFKRILISSLLIASVTASTSCSSDFFKKRINSPQAAAKQMVYAPELNPGVHELITDHSFKSLENDEPLRFETAVTPEEAANGTPVELKDNSGKTVSKMYDDGTHSDRIAGDGIYTCSYKPAPKDETSFSYTAKIGDTSTEPTSVRYFDKITDDDVKDMNGVGQKITEIQSRFLDSEGYVPDDKKAEAIDAVGEYVKELYNKGEAVEYRVNQEYNNVLVKLSSGITCVYSNPSKDTADGDSSSTTTANDLDYAVKQLTIKGYRPYSDYDDYEDKDRTNDYSYTLGEGTESIINDITSVSDFKNNIKNGGITLSTDVAPQNVKNFGPNQIIIWTGHGGYDGKLHSFLGTTHLFNYSEYTNDDMIEDRVLVQFLSGKSITDPTITNCRVCISSEYITAHCPDMTDSFVFLGACHSLQDSVLAASLLKKNCNVVVGFSDVVHIVYLEAFIKALTEEMCNKKTTASGTPLDYPSVQEAMDTVTDVNRLGLDYVPKEDSHYTYNTVTVPVIFGNRDYRFAEAIADELDNARKDAETKLGSFKLSSTYVSVDLNSTAKISVESFPVGYDLRSLIWTVDDDKIASISDYGDVYGIKAGHTRVTAVTRDGLYSQSCFINVRDY